MKIEVPKILSIAQTVIAMSAIYMVPPFLFDGINVDLTKLYIVYLLVITTIVNPIQLYKKFLSDFYDGNLLELEDTPFDCFEGIDINPDTGKKYTRKESKEFNRQLQIAMEEVFKD